MVLLVARLLPTSRGSKPLLLNEENARSQTGALVCVHHRRFHVRNRTVISGIVDETRSVATPDKRVKSWVVPRRAFVS